MSRSPRKLVYMNRGTGMSETLLRQWELLRAIPRAPRKIDVGTLMEKLAAAGYRISKRSLQRDLNHLSAVFPLVSDTQSIPYGWSWSTTAAAFDLPTMDGPTALTLRLIEQFIPTLLPNMIRDQLAPQFKRAAAVLAANPGNPLGHWSDCVRVVLRDMPLLAPKFNQDAIHAVYDALFSGHRFMADYRARTNESDEFKSYEVNPLGIVARGNLLYLMCTLWDYKDIRQLALHRVERAKPTDKPISKPDGFDLDRYIEQGEFQYHVGPMINLKAQFDRDASAHLHETPLSEDQTIQEADSDHVLVTATVRDTAQLEWWLSAFGPRVTVLEPADLRTRLAHIAKDTAALYDR